MRNIHIAGCDIEANMAKGGPPTANVLLDCADGSVAEVAITGCTIQHSKDAPDSANIRILGRGFMDRRGQSMPFKCGNVTIGDNVLSDVQTNIHLVGVRGVTITGNTFWQGYAHNMLIEDSDARAPRGRTCWSGIRSMATRPKANATWCSAAAAIARSTACTCTM